MKQLHLHPPCRTKEIQGPEYYIGHGIMEGEGNKSYTVHPNLNLLIAALFFLAISWQNDAPLFFGLAPLKSFGIEHILPYAFNNENDLHKNVGHFDAFITRKRNLIRALTQ